MFKKLIILKWFCVKDKTAVVLNASSDKESGRVLGDVTPPPNIRHSYIFSQGVRVNAGWFSGRGNP